MSCPLCGRDTYPGEQHEDQETADMYEGLDLCEGCDWPTDSCNCERM